MVAQCIVMIVWNVRGLNAMSRWNAVFQVVSSSRASIVCLQESKLENVTAQVVKQCMGNKF